MIKIFDVTLRDGIQSRNFIATSTKVKTLASLLKAGHKNLEITSFTKLPQFSDRQQFLSFIDRPKDVNYYGIIYNERSYEQLCSQQTLNGLSLLTSVSNNFSLRNVNREAKTLLNDAVKVLSLNSLRDYKSRVYISHAFSAINHNAKYINDINLNVVAMVDTLLSNGCDDIAISDTIGEATPKMVGLMCRTLKDEFPEHTTTFNNKFSFHFHGDKEKVLKNVDVCLEYGFLSFDSSVVDGWCPNSGTKHGNLNTIDVIDYMGEKCNIDKKEVCKIIDDL